MKVVVDWSSAEVGAHPGGRAMLTVVAPGAGTPAWRAVFQSVVRGQVNGFSALNCGEPQVGSDTISVVGVQEGTESDLRALIDRCVDEANEAAQAEQARRDESEAVSRRGREERQDTADRMADRFRDSGTD